ncbi:ARM repeat superfamily protein [Actinidia rufa]|uniref:ARM repeat superfamily protein n=1 Tax=Actinidia rufa TaxID=165716 RepID=A0A7J0E327_9ERIC|nr:ARM repeat superfamily protein [Actinidia rufa]
MVTVFVHHLWAPSDVMIYMAPHRSPHGCRNPYQMPNQMVVRCERKTNGTKGALTALDSSQEHFQKYYDAVMPYLKSILVNATIRVCMFRAKAMECKGLVGMVVGKAKFRDDAKQVKL